MKMLTVVPAYGRDYASSVEAAQAWAQDKDFRIADIGSMYDGKYVNRSDLDGTGTTARIRYKNLTRLVLIRPDGTVESDFTEEEA